MSRKAPIISSIRGRLSWSDVPIDNGQLTIDNFGVNRTYIYAFDAGFAFVKCRKRGALNVGAATCRPPRFEYNLWGWMVPRNVAAAICRQPARRAGIVVRSYPHRPTGPAPRRGWSGDESSPLHCSVYGVIPFNPTGYICHVAGGRLPPLQALYRVVPFNRTSCIRNVTGGIAAPT